jgi:ligand-binding sensor domain-containing protein/tRNA A-37 threonylcarbamoyl transferase component Bud32
MRSLRLLAALVLTLCLSARTLPVRRYESNLVILGMAQDRDGLLWLATAEGIVRFDGLHYEPVRPPANIDTSGGKDIAVTADGSVWLATDNGLVRYDHGVFSRELEGRLITALTVTPAGRVLACTDNDLYVALEPGRKPLRWAHQAGISVNGRFRQDLQGNTWFGCSLYLCKWSDSVIRQVAAGSIWTNHRSPSPIQEADATSRHANWNEVVATPDGVVWGRNGPEVLAYAHGRLASRNMPVETFRGVRPGFLLDHRGRLWIPGRQLRVVENGDINEGPPLTDVTAVLEDRRGTIWFGLAGKGLAALPDDATLRTWAEPEGIAGSVLDFAVNPRLGLLAASSLGSYVFDAAHDRWTLLGERAALRGLVTAVDGSVLSIPHAGGLLHGAREVPLPNEFNRRRLRYLYRDPQGTVWIASIDGLFRLGAGDRITPVPLPSKTVYTADLVSGTDGRLWVGHDGGVAVCTGDRCTDVITPRDGMLDARIRSIAPGGGEVWVAYRPGIGFSRFVQKPGGWTATHFRPDKGYGPVDTHFVRRDSRGWIWRGSTDGVYVCDGVHTEPEDWLHLTFGDGVNASYANMYAWLERDGAVWIGTQKGVVRLRPAVDWFAPAQVRVNRQDLEIHLAQPGLPPFQSRLFRYRLLPSEPQWRFSADGAVRYAKLGAGSYRFQAAAGGGLPPAEYSFVVEGTWVRWSIGTGIGLAVGALILWGRSREKKRAAEQYWREKREFLERRDAEEELSVAPADDWSGRTLDGRFLLERRIASGGFAAVYRGLDQAVDSASVAVKLYHPLRDNEQWRRRRFVEEVMALQKLRDPGIVEIRYAGEAAPDRPYLVMEFIDGVTLRELMNDGPIELERAALLLQQIGQALAAAHRAGVLHRDLKPENVMVTGESVKLIDFGIASLMEEQTRDHTTKLAGSPGYLAPERWVGLASPRSDVYSLAAIAAELLAGVPAAESGSCAGDPAAFRQRILERRPELPQATIDLLTAGLAYDPEARPADAEEFASRVC